jgi:hypothetical protein
MNLKKEAIKLIFGILYISLFITTVRYLNLNFIQTGILVCITAIFWNFKSGIKSILKSWLWIIGLMITIKLLQPLGIWNKWINNI